MSGGCSVRVTNRSWCSCEAGARRERAATLHALLPAPQVYNEGYWGTVAQASFSDLDAAVVCRELGYTGGSGDVIGRASHNIAPGTGPVWLSNVECSGREEALSQCNNGRPGLRKDVGHETDVAVACFYALDHRGKCCGGLFSASSAQAGQITCTPTLLLLQWRPGLLRGSLPLSARPCGLTALALSPTARGAWRSSIRPVALMAADGG